MCARAGKAPGACGSTHTRPPHPCCPSAFPLPAEASAIVVAADARTVVAELESQVNVPLKGDAKHIPLHAVRARAGLKALALCWEEAVDGPVCMHDVRRELTAPSPLVLRPDARCNVVDEVRPRDDSMELRERAGTCE